MSDARPTGDERRRARHDAEVPSSTYRIQLGARCGFSDVQALVPYLESLGIGAVYLSPVLQARTGSLHGYDTVNFGQLNVELGGRAAFEAMACAIRERGLGLVLDVVPNHMSVDPVENKAWRDVLENGPSAEHAEWFDIDWEPVTRALAQKVLLPILGDQYGTALERGEIRVALREGRFEIVYGTYRLPFNPELVPLIFEGAAATLREQHGECDDARELQEVLAAFAGLPPYTVRDYARRETRRVGAAEATVRLSRLLTTTPIRDFANEVVTAINGQPGVPESFDRLHTLLEHQAYRLAYWRTALDEINYRRFFDVNEMAAVRMEDLRVFAAAHQIVLDLVGRGLVTGLRIDHPDGLADPAAYFERLQAAASHAKSGEPATCPSARALYIVAEKIVSPGEPFPSWPIHGGTGYRFLNQITGLFVDRPGLHRIERSWARRTQRKDSFDEIAYECRRLIASSTMSSEMNMIAHALEDLAGRDRCTRDFTLNSLRQVLREVVASFSVYRTYVSERGVSDADRAVVQNAIAEARRRSPVMDETIFAFVERVLLPDVTAGDEPAWLRFAMRMQQITGPIQAKGLEDTAFYRYTPLLAINEVGSHPAAPTLSVEEFHAASLTRLGNYPATMTTVATHDTKRSGDARARLVAISERATEWTRAVALWSTVNARHRISDNGARYPDAEDEYHLYQTLLAIWPPEPDGSPAPAALPEALVSRLEAYLIKAVREAKRRSSWLRTDATYERALVEFARTITRGAGARRFLAHFAPFAQSLARQGAVNSLAQAVIWLGSPGVPDVYQGSETWHLHLVDPDNRTPVDFSRHAARLAELDPWLTRAEVRNPNPDVTAYVSRLVTEWHDGSIKSWCLATGLRHRRRDPDLFLAGGYVPLTLDPPDTPVVAFARVSGPRALIVAAPRLAGRLTRDGSWPLGAVWSGAHILLPHELGGHRWHDRLTARQLDPTPASASDPHVPLDRIPLDQIFAVLPSAWLERIDVKAGGTR